MKTFLFPRLLALATSLAVPSIPAVAADSAGAAPLYITIDYADPVAFERSRYAREDGSELILNTLKSHAEKEAAFAQLGRPVIVPQEGAPLPAGADVLRLTWTNGSVTADFSDDGAKPKYLGVVSRTALAFHPDHDAMDREIRRAGLADRVRDAQLRVATRLSLYEGLLRVARETRQPSS